MTSRKAILDGNDVVRRNHLKRLADGPDGIAHLVPADDGKAEQRRKLNDDVAEIGRRNRAAAMRAAKRRTKAGSAK
ncbi:hypothetical protein [Hoeflea prorocentri]|uniref:Uncharacterized protein n=1 Tax=Hoeflea prorocentri TaxID=1922333 RepID=A0A9X3UGP4_9HYPH|nr:hypothetical protein [Hoeflea prorocentri]MCY6380972.1 hypothetical protein [Hoeflea prorocentri]MDA5398772.1 hypothetical protein [Hoeflea prorocentri]